MNCWWLQPQTLHYINFSLSFSSLARLIPYYPTLLYVNTKYKNYARPCRVAAGDSSGREQLFGLCLSGLAATRSYFSPEAAARRNYPEYCRANPNNSRVVTPARIPGPNLAARVNPVFYTGTNPNPNNLSGYGHRARPESLVRNPNKLLGTENPNKFGTRTPNRRPGKLGRLGRTPPATLQERTRYFTASPLQSVIGIVRILWDFLLVLRQSCDL